MISKRKNNPKKGRLKSTQRKFYNQRSSTRERIVEIQAKLTLVAYHERNNHTDKEDTHTPNKKARKKPTPSHSPQFPYITNTHRQHPFLHPSMLWLGKNLLPAWSFENVNRSSNVPIRRRWRRYSKFDCFGPDCFNLIVNASQSSKLLFRPVKPCCDN